MACAVGTGDERMRIPKKDRAIAEDAIRYSRDDRWPDRAETLAAVLASDHGVTYDAGRQAAWAGLIRGEMRAAILYALRVNRRRKR